MVSVMATESEVFGSCVGEIDVSVGMENRGAWLCCGWDYLRIALAGKVVQNRRGRWEMVPGIESAFRCFIGTLGVIEELQSPCCGRGVMELGIYIHQESLSSESHRLLLRLPAPLQKSLTELS